MSGQRRGGGGPGASMGNRSSRATTTTTTTMTPPSPSPSSSVRDDATPRRGRSQGHGEDDTDESAIPPPFLERRDAAAVFERLYSSLWTTPSSSTSSSSVDLNDDPEGREAAPDDDDDEIDAIGRRLGGSRAPSSSNCEVEWTTPKVTSSPSLSTTSTTSMTMRTTTLLTEDEKRGARCAAISLFVACALLVGVLSSSWRAAVGPGSATGGRGGEAMPPSSNADEVIGGDGNDKFVIGEEEMALMEMEGDLYYYDDDDYDGNDHRDDDAAYYDGSEVDATSEAMAAAALDEEDDPLLYNAYSTTTAQDAGDGPDTSEEVAGTGTGGGGGAIAAMITTAEASTAIRGVNDGGQCSVIRPVDYDSIHRRGTGYESFPGYQCYRTVDGTRSTVIDLIDKYPNLTSRVVLSDYPTAEMGESLRVLVITNKNKQTPIGKGKMMVVSSIHARELATSEAMTRFAEYLLQQYGIDPDVTWIVDFTEIHLIFHANPDGRQYLEMGGERTMWKKNRNKGDCANEAYGVDPNRNFPFKWGECVTTSDNRCSSSGDCSSVVYRGPSPMSEQETKAILSYAKTVFPSGQRKGSTVKIAEGRLTVPFAEDSEGVFIDVHSHGRDVGWPWGFVNQRTPNDAGLGALGRKFASFSGYSLWAPKMPNRVYGLDGSTMDTMYGWLGAASFFFEIGTSFYQPCNEFSTVINDVFPALLYAAKVAKQPYKTPRGPDVLCTTITSSGEYTVATIQVSDSARAKHADDGGLIFSTGKQTLKTVEIYVNCHPLYSATSCTPTKTLSVTGSVASKTVTVMFKSPSRVNNVMYIRAIDSDQYAGPVTARKFVGG